MANVLAVFVGGTVGASLRYWINVGLLGFGFPLGTVVENLLGSFLLGVISGVFLVMQGREWVKVGLGVGLCGGFTTMSTFGGDAFHLLMDGLMLEAASYVIVSVIFGIAFAFLGFHFGSKAGALYLKSGKVGAE
ncbi:CrcB family protein [Bacillus tianshenii]|uniref:fluoride efflux transporter FluC n=1 Tax=Sutcliffiella tianshenii TaxID=1463404 RepID=UPI001CD609DE|nr:CrcB family protein [Bacillus tianshenii]MCA1321428.1 CrcB family protein [Bacillus tianshenii]